MPSQIPFEFVLDRLLPADPVVKPMFGCHAIYIRDKIVLVVRKKADEKSDNGVWLATSKEHHESLKKEFPSMRSIGVFGVEQTGWQNLPESSKNFEESVMKACDLILRNDPRIGKVPKPKTKARRK